MPLNIQEASELETAIAAYQFPPVYFDFGRRVEVLAPDMRAVEAALRDLLVSEELDRIKDGLANIVYWGYAQIGYRDKRVLRFRNNVLAEQLGSFRAIVASGRQISLDSIGKLGMPEFSGISFISKVLAFLNPSSHCVLDKQLLKLAVPPGNRALHQVRAGTQIRVTLANQNAYDAWRAECAGVSERYFGRRYRVVDIERGFFQLVQTDQVALAQRIYVAA